MELGDEISKSFLEEEEYRKLNLDSYMRDRNRSRSWSAKDKILDDVMSSPGYYRPSSGVHSGTGHGAPTNTSSAASNLNATISDPEENVSTPSYNSRRGQIPVNRRGSQEEVGMDTPLLGDFS